MTDLISAANAALRLGPKALANLAYYQFQCKTGVYQLRTPVHRYAAERDCGLFRPLPLPDLSAIRAYTEKDPELLNQADRLANSHFFPFMGENETHLDFSPLHPDQHWSRIRLSGVSDVKLVWEPSRFCWAYTLIRAWTATQDDRWAEVFFQQLNIFTQKNPPNLGENWLSAQEVGIRLINIVLCAGFFIVTGKEEDSVKENRRHHLAQIIQAHAKRIPSTICYARSQNNNHILSEAAALITAACVLPESEDANRWLRHGWRVFCTTLNEQIDEDGCYIQQSTNYHRLMLQLVLLVNFLLPIVNLQWPEKLRNKIIRSIDWLAKLTEAQSGAVCNLGHNDGAYLFPIGGDYGDFRPIIQALRIAFTGETIFPNGPWDEQWLWFDPGEIQQTPPQTEAFRHSSMLHLQHENHRAYLRAATFHARPAHDDQLHADLWLNGRNVAMDAGTYRYSAAKPWANALKTAFVHNTLLLDDKEPMRDAGKFLWANWDQASCLAETPDIIRAEHDAWHRIGLDHQRSIEYKNGWHVLDNVSPHAAGKANQHLFRLHWLLPDSPYRIEQTENGWSISLDGFVCMILCDTAESDLSIIRAGNTVFRTDSSIPSSLEEVSVRAVSGFESRKYDERKPALSLIVRIRSSVPFQIETRFIPNAGSANEAVQFELL